MNTDYLSLIDKTTHGRYDISPIFADPTAYRQLIDDLLVSLADCDFDALAAIDALGFLMGAPIALHLERPLVLLRKQGKLPGHTRQASFTDYSSTKKALEAREGMLKPGSRVLILDDWVETASQVHAAARLVEALGYGVAAIVAISIDNNLTVAALRQRYRMISLVNDF